jgi:hypothetical protein
MAWGSAAPARASEQTVPVTLAAISLLPAAVLMIAVLVSDKKFQEDRRGWEIAFYAGGAVGIGFGVTAVAIEAGIERATVASRRTVYGIGGAGIGVGVLSLAIGIAVTATAPKRSRRALLIPTPMLLPTEGRTAMGVGLVHTGF